MGKDSCDRTWLDPEPDANTDDHKRYLSVMKKVSDGDRFTWIYKGHVMLPSEEEYREIVACE